MFVKLDDVTILDMATGTCYCRMTARGSDDYNEVVITFNGQQTDKRCSNEVAYGLWNWLDIAAMKFGTDPA